MPTSAGAPTVGKDPPFGLSYCCLGGLYGFRPDLIGPPGCIGGSVFGGPGHLSGNLGGKRGCIKMGNFPDARDSPEKTIPAFFGPDAQRGYQTKTRYYNSPHGV